MKNNKRNSNSNINEMEEKKTVELPVLDFFKINLLSFIVPLYPCLGLFILYLYLFLIIFPLDLIFHLFIIPSLIIALYFVYLILLVEFTALWASRWHKKSPPKQGVFQRVLDDLNSEEGKMMKYYHKRGFIIKYPMWLTSKSMFPWLVNRALRKISHNKIAHNVIYCDAYVGLEFTDLGENTFFYPTSALSSHAVNTIFGKITMLEIKLGDNTTMYPGTIAGPNAVTNANNVIFPNTVLHKNWRGKPDKFFYQGSPGRPIERNYEK
jgi:hypothetical protein